MRDVQDDKIRLIERAQAGDRLSFGELYTKYARVILFLTKKYLWSKDDVEDVAQTAVLNMYSGISKLQNPAAFDGWLHALVKNACINHNKSYSRIRENETDDETEMEFLEARNEYVPEKSLLKNELIEEIGLAMAKLPESYRQALYLYYYKQMSYAEIAEATGITASTVSTNMMKGKAKLKELLEKTSNIDGGDVELLRGVAFGPAIAHAFFEEEVSLRVGASEVSDFVKATNAKLGVQGSTLGQTKTSRVGKSIAVSSKAIVAILSAAAILITAAIFIINPTGSADSSSEDFAKEVPVAASTVPAAEVAAQIVLSSGDDSPTDILNPISASLETESGTAEEWRIVGEGGDTLFSGTGSSLSDELLLLDSGKYTLEWDIKEGDKAATATRSFDIRR